MMSTDRLERDVAAMLAELATPHRPEFTDDILLETATTPQRPRWTYLALWLPEGVTARWITAGRLPRLAIGLLVTIALLIALGVAALIGTYRPLPPPFGLAANGLVAYEKGGDIFTVDPATGERSAISLGPEHDHDIRWSLDGTRLAFLRTTPPGEVLMVVDTDGRVVARSERPGIDIDSDTVAWSPDGRSIAFAEASTDGRTITLMDALTGKLTQLPVDYTGLEVYWRPPDGRQLLFLGGPSEDVASLFLYSLDDGRVDTVPLDPANASPIRTGGWTPDGRHVVVHAIQDWFTDGSTHLVDPDTGAERVVEVALGRVSHDGRRFLGFADARFCVISIDGGPCGPIGTETQVPDAGSSAAFQWSPDDQWILSLQPEGSDHALDSDGEVVQQPSWAADGAEAWQRVAD